VDALPKLIHPETGRLHTSFSQTGTATAGSAPAIRICRIFPFERSWAARFAPLFVAEKGNVLLSADYSQIELPSWRIFRKILLLVDAFRSGEDIHARTAQKFFGVGPLAQTAEHRRAAKAINFGIIYGLSPFGLAQQLGIRAKRSGQIY